MTIAELIAELKAAYEAAGHTEHSAELLPPASDADLATLEQELGFAVPPELREVWCVHGGQEYTGAGTTGLSGSHRLLTPAESEEQRQLSNDTCLPPDEYVPQGGYVPWAVYFVPFAAWDQYTLCVNGHSGEVWDHAPSAGMMTHRPSVRSVLEELLAAVRVGREPELEWDED